MKKTLFALYFIVCSYVSPASHITGGEMTYQYIGPGIQPNTKIYRITLKLFRDEHTTGAPMPPEVYIGLFNNDNNTQFPPSGSYYRVSKSTEQNVSVNPYPPCINNIPDLHYNVGSYTREIELPDNAQGYTATYQTCCRVSPLINVYNSVGSGAGGTGSTYSCIIPPITDNSPKFNSNIDLICLLRDFTLDFSATDADGDSLVYSFCEAYDGGLARNANNINPARPPYTSVEYINGFSFSKPLGDLAYINPVTGIITGTAPGFGKYVVCVCVKSYKNGKYVGEHRKDFIINVGDCDYAGAQLDLKPVICDGLSVAFNNANSSLLNKTFFWNFGDPESGALNTSTLATPVHQFSDTGVYVYKLVVNKGEACSDSTTQVVKVYPGFFPGFTTQGQCKNTPIRFTDTTQTNYGIVNSWTWNFGDTEILEDTSRLKNPSYTFKQSGDYNVQLIVTNNKGCIDTFSIIKAINDQPDFSIADDTLICSIDTLTLKGTGNGKFFWTPAYNINNQTANSPLVSPDVSTMYYAAFSDAFGCKGIDSVLVDVKSFVRLNAGNDTNICRGDPIQLNPVSDALHYKWTPAASLNNNILKNPVATPLTNTTYSLTGSIGKCKITDTIQIKVTPYPVANAGADSIICIGNTTQLKSSGGTIYKWSPALFLNNANIPNPVANPKNDIVYVVTVSDTLGCPKPADDTVLIRVLNVIADAGPRDTSVVVNQPLQLSATGGEFYLWNPSTGLNNPETANPEAQLSNNQQYIVKATTAGCFDTDTINVTVYKTDPGLYIPTAFTPDKNGINDVFKLIPIGMKTITYFRVYNRWGQLMFSSSTKAKGWDGTFSGKPQDAGVYVWMVEGIDYLDNKIIKKGSVILIR